jgi:hypothetical protein
MLRNDLGHPESIHCRLKDQPVPFLAGAQCPLGPLAFVNILDDLKTSLPSREEDAMGRDFHIYERAVLPKVLPTATVLYPVSSREGTVTRRGASSG